MKQSNLPKKIKDLKKVTDVLIKFKQGKGKVSLSNLIKNQYI